MLLVNTKDGRTLHFDLFDAAQETAWARECSRENFQRSITGLGILWDGVRHSLPAPTNFPRLLFQAEAVRDTEGKPIALRCDCIANEAMVSLFIFMKTGAAKVTLQRIGRTRWTPHGMPARRT